MVHQHFSLVPRMTVVENLMLGQAKGVLKRREFARAHRATSPRASASTLDPDARRRRPLGRRAPARRDREVPDARPAAAGARRADRRAAAGRDRRAARHLPPRRRLAAAPSSWSPTSWPRSPRSPTASTVLRAGRVVAERRAWPTPTWARWCTPWSAATSKPLDVRAGRARRRGACAPTRRRPPAPRASPLVCDGLDRAGRHGARAARQLHPRGQARRDRRPRRRRGQRPERARHGAGRPAAADRGPLLRRRHATSPHAGADGDHGGRRRHRAGGPPRRGLRHRHVAWPRTCS